MHHNWKMELYWRLPIFLQNAAVSIYAIYLERLYYGSEYEEWCRYFRNGQNWSRSDFGAWQNERLQSIIELAALQVPHYRDKWQKVDWRSARTVNDLHILPLLEKQSLRGNEQDFLVEGLNPKSLWMDRTSGSTGTALKIFWPNSMLPKWWALMEVMVRNVAGVGQHLPRSMMGGRPVVRGNTSQPPYWRFNKRWRQLYLSSYHVSRETTHSYVAAIREYGSEWITGYGSALAVLAENALAAGIPPVPLRAVIVSGDTLLPRMRYAIEKFFQCKCFDQYGLSEGVCMAMECHQERMHVVPMAGILEILDENGLPCQPGQVGEIVATSLLNEAMPLIRYRLGDYGAWAEDQICPCGNPHPVLKSIEGRTDDYLLTKDGRKIGRLSTALKRSPTIHSMQIVQDTPGHAFLLVRPGDGYCAADSIAIRDDILERIGIFHFEIIEVPEIPKTPQGKTRLVVRLQSQPGDHSLYSRIFKKRVV